MPRSAGLTPKQFRLRAEEARKRAELLAAQFASDTPAKQLRRKAESVVLPERFNANYLEHWFPLPAAQFHLELYRALEADRRIVVRAPRGHAKSTVVTFAYTTHQVVCAPVLRAWEEGLLATVDPALDAEIRLVMREELARRLEDARATHAMEPSPASGEMVAAGRLALEVGIIPLHFDPYIQIISVTEDTATEFTEAIRDELIANEKIRSDWGVVLDNPRVAAGDWVSATDVRVRAFGMMGAIRGGKHKWWRPRLAIFDDPDSEETVGTSRIRQKQEKKLTAGVKFGLEPKRSRVMVAGTPIHADCLVCRLTAPERFRRWTKLRYKVIRDDGSVLWPERWTIEDLRAEEEEDPESFAMEMLDLPPSTGKPFTLLHYYDRAVFADADLPKVLWFDPSLGKTETSDLQAVVVLRGPTPEGWVLVHRVEFLRIGDPFALVERINAIAAEEGADVNGIETIGFQLLLEAMLQSDALRDGLLIGWERLDTQRDSKDVRIRGLAGPTNRGILRFPNDRAARPLEHQFLDYPDGKRDGVDVTEMAYRVIRRQSRQRTGRNVRHQPRERADLSETSERLNVFATGTRRRRPTRREGWV